MTEALANGRKRNLAVIYEITATVRADLCEAYEDYMRDRHIPDLIATGAFERATFSRSEPGRYRISYETISRETLEEYLREHAPRLRAHMIETFPDGVEVSREEWEVLAEFAPEHSTR